MGAFGDGSCDTLDSEAAVALAATTAPISTPGISADSHGIAVSERIVIAATDTGVDPTEGELYAIAPRRPANH